MSVIPQPVGRVLSSDWSSATSQCASERGCCAAVARCVVRRPGGHHQCGVGAFSAGGPGRRQQKQVLQRRKRWSVCVVDASGNFRVQGWQERLSVSNYPTNLSEEAYRSDPSSDVPEDAESGNAQGISEALLIRLLFFYLWFFFFDMCRSRKRLQWFWNFK